MGPKSLQIGLKKKASPPSPHKRRSSSKVSPSAPSEPPAPAPSPSPSPAPSPLPPSDPWRSLRSPYGGKLSPGDEWKRLACGYDERRALEVTGVTAEGLGVALARETEAGATGTEAEASETETVPTATEAETVLPPPSPPPSPPPPPPPLDTLLLSNCSFALQDSFPVPPSLLPQLISLSAVSCGLSGKAVEGALRSPNFLRLLDLTNNLLASVPSSIFAFSPNLLNLNLSHNPFASPALAASAFSSPGLAKSLRALNLENCRLANVVEALAPLSQLKVLNISCNCFCMDEMKRMQTSLAFKKLEDLTIHPMQTLTDDPAYNSEFSLLLKKMICLKQLDGSPFSQTIAVDIAALKNLDLLAGGGDDPNVKDSASCSCVEGNACASKYNCRPHIWHRRFEVAKLAREGGADFPREKYISGEM